MKTRGVLISFALLALVGAVAVAARSLSQTLGRGDSLAVSCKGEVLEPVWSGLTDVKLQCRAAPSNARRTFSMGSTAKTTDGHSVTVLAFAAPVQPDVEFAEPGPGRVFATIDARQCAGPGGYERGHVTYTLKYADDTTWRPVYSVKEPSLELTTLAPGECVRGFVSFEIPAGKTPAYVYVEITSDDFARTDLRRWRIG